MRFCSSASGGASILRRGDARDDDEMKGARTGAVHRASADTGSGLANPIRSDQIQSGWRRQVRELATIRVEFYSSTVLQFYCRGPPPPLPTVGRSAARDDDNNQSDRPIGTEPSSVCLAARRVPNYIIIVPIIDTNGAQANKRPIWPSGKLPLKQATVIVISGQRCGQPSMASLRPNELIERRSGSSCRRWLLSFEYPLSGANHYHDRHIVIRTIYRSNQIGKLIALQLLCLFAAAAAFAAST